MSSTLHVTIEPIKEVKPHSGADRLDLLIIKGWQVVAQKDKFNVGDLVIFIPPDAILPEKIHTKLGITKYCASLPKIDGETPVARRVKATRLRGEASYGTIMTLVDYYDILNIPHDAELNFNAGDDVAEHLKITKWEPPIKSTQGDVQKDNPAFHTYTNIENWRNYPELFTEDDEIVVTSKIHGTNWRGGYMLDEDENGEANLVFMAGSHKTRRKSGLGLYWEPFDWYPKLKGLLQNLYLQHEKPILVFGEIYGSGVQDLSYGLLNGHKELRIFDISIGGEYIDYDEFVRLCTQYELPNVVELYRGKYNKEIIEQHTNGDVVECEENKLTTKFKGREGIVFKTIKEQQTRIGRKILKSVSVDYLDRKNATDNE